MTRINQKILCVAAASLALSGCALSPTAQEARYLRKGEEALQKKNYETAILHFKSAVQAQPRDAEAYYNLGLAYAALNQFSLAVPNFRKACELNPEHVHAQLHLAQIMSRSRDREAVEDAQKRLRDLLTLVPDDAEVLDVLAFTELRLGQPESAEDHLQHALQKSPDSLKSSITLAQTKVRRHDVAGAEAVLKQAVAQSPKSPEARVILGGFYAAWDRATEAERQFRDALGLDPKHGPALLALGALLVRAKRMDEADQVYGSVSALPDKNYRPIHALFLLRSGKGDQAVRELQQLARTDPEDRILRTDLVRAYLVLNRRADAEKVLTAALKKNSLDSEALLQRSRLYLASEKFGEAEVDLNQVLRYQSGSAEAHYLLSKVRLARGLVGGQQRELREALRLAPTLLAVRLELARSLIANHDAESAVGLLDEAESYQKNTVPAAIARNWALIALGRTDEARQGIETVLSVSKNPQALVQNAALKLAQKDCAGARASAEEVLHRKPDDVVALRLLVQSYLAQDQVSMALQRARDQASLSPSSARLQQYVGELLLAYGDRAGARRAFDAALAATPGLAVAELGLAELEVTDGKQDAARKLLTDVVSAHPGYLPGHLYFAHLEMTQGRSAAAVEQYRQAMTLDDKNVIALNGLAYAMAENGQANLALQYAQKAKGIAPDNAAVADTLGWTYYRMGLYKLAVTNLEEASARQDTALREYHLAMAWLKAGDARRGRERLEAALKKDSHLPEAGAARQLFGIATP